MRRIISLFILVFVSISIFANSYDSDPRLKPDIVPFAITLFGDTSVSEQTRLHYLPQQIKGICGVKFGTEENEACAFLRNKFGSSGDWLNGQTLRFEKIKYGGTSFDSVNFLFQSDGLKSVLNGCILHWLQKTELPQQNVCNG